MAWKVRIKIRNQVNNRTWIEEQILDPNRDYRILDKSLTGEDAIAITIARCSEPVHVYGATVEFIESEL